MVQILNKESDFRTTPWLKHNVGQDMLQKYISDCTTPKIEEETVNELDLPDCVFDSLGQEDIDKAAEAAITW